MTMQIESSESIAGIPLAAIRKFFRHIINSHSDGFSSEWLEEQLDVDPRVVSQVIQELVKKGFVDDGEGYVLTEKGRSLARASAAGKVSRKTAESALTGLLERVQGINQDPNKIDTITAVAVFGSYLSDSDQVGDLDVAVKFVYRYPDRKRSHQALEYAKQSGRGFSRFIDRLHWHSTELELILKARKRTISLQDWGTFVEIAQTPGFAYRVVFGDAESVRNEIEQASETLDKPILESPSTNV